MQKILIITLILLITAPAYAATYLLQDVEKNMSHIVYLFTYNTEIENTYDIGMFNGNIWCGIDEVYKNINTELVSGTCIELPSETSDSHIYYWTEVESDTFYNEVQNIIEERKNQGLYLRNYEGN